MATKNDNLIWQ